MKCRSATSAGSGGACRLLYQTITNENRRPEQRTTVAIGRWKGSTDVRDHSVSGKTAPAPMGGALMGVIPSVVTRARQTVVEKTNSRKATAGCTWSAGKEFEGSMSELTPRFVSPHRNSIRFRSRDPNGLLFIMEDRPWRRRILRISVIEGGGSSSCRLATKATTAAIRDSRRQMPRRRDRPTRRGRKKVTGANQNCRSACRAERREKNSF